MLSWVLCFTFLINDMKLVPHVIDKTSIKPFLLILCGGWLKYDSMDTLNMFRDDLVG